MMLTFSCLSFCIVQKSMETCAAVKVLLNKTQVVNIEAVFFKTHSSELIFQATSERENRMENKLIEFDHY